MRTILEVCRRMGVESRSFVGFEKMLKEGEVLLMERGMLGEESGEFRIICCEPVSLVR